MAIKVALKKKIKAKENLLTYCCHTLGFTLYQTLTFMTQPEVLDQVITRDEILHQWEGHRKLTRRTLEAFPEKELFTFSIGGMRPFSELIKEMLSMSEAGIEGLVTDKWYEVKESDHFGETEYAARKQYLLDRWDAVTERIAQRWPLIPEGRFQEMTLAFAQYNDKGYRLLCYFIDNEIHHRGQGYVYLRALGIEPPPFWDRP
jgi:uncharacterized damage-inducible protein DinB